MTMTATSRGNYLGAKITLGITATLTFGYLVSTALASVADGISVPSSVGSTGPEVSSPVVQGATGEYTSDVVWHIADPAWWEVLLALVPSLIGTAVVLFAAVHLWRLIQAAQSGSAFSERAYRRVRDVGIVILTWGMLAPVVTLLTTMLVTWGRMEQPETTLTVRLGQFWPVLVGGLMLVLADVFRQGEALRADTEGLI